MNDPVFGLRKARHHDTFRGDWRSTGFGHAFVTFGLDHRRRVRTLELEGSTTFRRAGGG